jgi:hypothetical protein
MDGELTTGPVVTDGIYATCEICFAIVADPQAHTAWHESRGEVSNDANDQRT